MSLRNPKHGIGQMRMNSVARYIGCSPQEAERGHQSIAPENEGYVGIPRFIVHPLCGAQSIDVTQKVIEAIAHELWNSRGGNDLLNWLEAERLYNQTMRALNGDNDGAASRRSRSAGIRHRNHRRRVQSHARVAEKNRSTPAPLASAKLA